jgi:hypothetical protein
LDYLSTEDFSVSLDQTGLEVRSRYGVGEVHYTHLGHDGVIVQNTSSSYGGYNKHCDI